MVVADGAVAATGLQSELAGDTSRFAEVLDLGADATLLPGLINMHA
ncbi:MAG: hypothetical protein GWO03_06390, partial [Gammaproteobacteria bacterium]|nr:hypothetical protein [Gammaproteobacteria bacterium]